MPKIPERIGTEPSKSPQIIETGLSMPQIREIVNRWEAKAEMETAKLRQQTPAWTPEFDEGIIMMPPRRMLEN